MKYYSELLQKPFDTEKECLQAEKEFKRKMIRDYLMSELDDNGRSIIYAGSD